MHYAQFVSEHVITRWGQMAQSNAKCINTTILNTLALPYCLTLRKGILSLSKPAYYHLTESCAMTMFLALFEVIISYSI